MGDQFGEPIVTMPSEREVRVVRTFQAPRERVFAAYTDPELIPKWWGPYGTTAIVDLLEPWVGGRWRFVVQDPLGGENGFRGVLREFVVPERLVWTFEWEGNPGHVSIDSTTFENLGDRTRIDAVSLFHTQEERDSMLDAGMETGLNETYARLDALLGA